jgi:hypothetical protein
MKLICDTDQNSISQRAAGLALLQLLRIMDTAVRFPAS